MGDVLVAFGLALLSGVTAYMGWYVTLHPPAEESKKHWKTSFVFVSAVTIVLVVLQAYRMKKSGDSLNYEIASLKDQISVQGIQITGAIKDESQRPINVPPPVVKLPEGRPTRFARVTVSGLTPVHQNGTKLFILNEALGINLHFSNSGNDTAENVNAAGEIDIAADTSEGTQKQLISSFQNVVRSSRELGGATLPAAPKDIWVTATGPVLSQKLWDQLVGGTSYMFLIDIVRYRDANGTWEQHHCLWMQQPRGDDGLKTDQIIWHTCNYYNDRTKLR